MDTAVRDANASDGNDRPNPQNRQRPPRRRRHRRIEPYAWLATGAVGVGIAAALATPAVAYAADEGGSSSASASSTSSSDTSSDNDGDATSTKQSATSSRSGPPTTSDADDDSDGNSRTSVDIEHADTEHAEDSASDQDADDGDAESAQSRRPKRGTTKSDVAEDRAADNDRAANSNQDDSAVESDGPTAETTPPAPTTAVEPSSAATRSSAASSVSVATSTLNEPDVSAASSKTAPVVMSSASVAVASPPKSTFAEMIAQFLRSFLNASPTATPRQNAGQSDLGVVSGNVGAADRDGDPLSVQLSKNPTKGSVVVDADGSFVYTPSNVLASTGGTDKFTVIVRELNAADHTHGLKGIIAKLTGSSDDGSWITKVVTVTISKVAAGGSGAIPDGGSSTPTKHDAGLSDDFILPSAPTGRTLNVRDYGATSNNSANNDATAIQNAIKAATAGDTVYIPNGTYHVSSVITLKSGVSLIGESREGTILAGKFASSVYAVVRVPAGVNDLTISSFSIIKSSGASFKAGVSLGSEGSTLVSRIAVKDLRIENFQRFGVQLTNAYQVLVDGNQIRNASALDGGGSGYGILIDQSGSSNNWIKNNTIGPVIRHGILIQEHAHNNLVEYNTVTGAVSGAIDLHGEDEYLNEIRYNTVSDCVRNGTTVSPNGAGIEIGEYSGIIGTDVMHDNSGPYNWIHHNVVYNCSCGLRIVNNSNHTYIEDNIFYNNLSAGIKADLAPLNNLHITGNTIYNNGSGILLNDVTKAVVQGNIITDNLKYGIWTNKGVTDFIISGNTLAGNNIDMLLGSLLGILGPNNDTV